MASDSNSLNPALNSFSSLALHHNDNPAISIVLDPQTGPNYISWSHAIKCALSVKNNLQLIDRSLPIPKEVDDRPIYVVWVRANYLVLNLTLNSISPEIKQFLEYFTGQERYGFAHLQQVPDFWGSVDGMIYNAGPHNVSFDVKYRYTFNNSGSGELTNLSTGHTTKDPKKLPRFIRHVKDAFHSCSGAHLITYTDALDKVGNCTSWKERFSGEPKCWVITQYYLKRKSKLSEFPVKLQKKFSRKAKYSVIDFAANFLHHVDEVLDDMVRGKLYIIDGLKMILLGFGLNREDKDLYMCGKETMIMHLFSDEILSLLESLFEFVAHILEG